MIWVNLLVNGVILILDIQLIGLHIYLKYLGLTTYQFIINSRHKNAEKKVNLSYMNII